MVVAVTVGGDGVGCDDWWWLMVMVMMVRLLV